MAFGKQRLLYLEDLFILPFLKRLICKPEINRNGFSSSVGLLRRARQLHRIRLFRHPSDGHHIPPRQDWPRWRRL